MARARFGSDGGVLPTTRLSGACRSKLLWRRRSTPGHSRRYYRNKGNAHAHIECSTCRFRAFRLLRRKIAKGCRSRGTPDVSGISRFKSIKVGEAFSRYEQERCYFPYGESSLKNTRRNRQQPVDG